MEVDEEQKHLYFERQKAQIAHRLMERLDEFVNDQVLILHFIQIIFFALT